MKFTILASALLLTTSTFAQSLPFAINDSVCDNSATQITAAMAKINSASGMPKQSGFVVSSRIITGDPTGNYEETLVVTSIMGLKAHPNGPLTLNHEIQINILINDGTATCDVSSIKSTN